MNDQTQFYMLIMISIAILALAWFARLSMYRNRRAQDNAEAFRREVEALKAEKKKNYFIMRQRQEDDAFEKCVRLAAFDTMIQLSDKEFQGGKFIGYLVFKDAPVTYTVWDAPTAKYMHVSFQQEVNKFIKKEIADFQSMYN